MPNQPKTPLRKVRLDDELWAQLGELAQLAGTDRSSVIRQLAQRWVRTQRKRSAASSSAAQR